MPTLLLSTGLSALDELVGETDFLEFFGKWDTVNLLAHRFIVEHSGEVEVLLTQNFGAFDTYLLRRMGKNLGKRPEAEIARAFSLPSTVELLEGALSSDAPVAAVVDPYLFAPSDWRSYHLLTPITAALRHLAHTKPVVVFNRVTQFGKNVPEGGEYHLHTVPVLVEVSATPKAMLACLIKHPASPARRVWLPYPEIYGERVGRTGVQRALTEWGGAVA